VICVARYPNGTSVDVTSTDLMTMLERSLTSRSRLHFIPSGTSVTSVELWVEASRAAAWLGGRLAADAPVAMVLDSSVAAVAALLGAWRAGRRVVSVPLPPRASSLEWYQSFVEEACCAGGADLLLVAGELVPLLPPMKVRVAAFEEASDAGAGAGFVECPDTAELVQFTSGSTSDPKGVVLGMPELGANVSAILDVLDPQPGDGACSWLPLSHDMGLIGMLLTGLCGSGPDHADGADLVLIKPDWFLHRPGSWLQACTEFASTITAAPDFGFAQAMRRGVRGSLDLGRLRVCITGAEPVRPATLTAFADAFAPAGFDPMAFCPAYGLAEAGLAVTMTRPGAHWSTIEVDPDALASAEVRLVEGGQPLVSCGPPLPGYEVRIAGDPALVGVSGPSLYRRYIPGDVRPDPWLTTSDLGVVHDGELYVAGRTDDVVLLGGRKVFLTDVDAQVGGRVGIRPGRVQAVAVDGGFAVLAEAGGRLAPPETAAAIRLAAVAYAGWNPSQVVIVEKGSLPRTASGKPRRRESARRLVADQFPVVHRAGPRPVSADRV
jgi:acyl-CoA synthetase (AMP-forming)/AMP-acid ligase II